MTFGPWQFGTTELIAVVQIVVVICIAFLAREGVKNWNKKRATLRTAEVAEKCLALMYEAEDVFRYIRFADASIPFEDLKLQGRKKADALYQHGMDRVTKYAGYFERVQAHLPITKALLGEAIFNGLRDVLLIRNDITYALQDRHELSLEEPSTGSPEERLAQDNDKRARANEYRRIIFGNFDENDEVYKRYLRTCAFLESKLLPLIRTEYPRPEVPSKAGPR